VLSSLNRDDDAKRVGEEGRRAATQVLERHPTHMLALRGRALIFGGLAVVADNEMRQAERLALAEGGAHDWALIARIDPSNMVAWNNLGASQGVAFAALLDMGCPREALAKTRETRTALEPHATSSAMPTVILANAMASSAYLAVDVGAAATSDSVREYGTRLIELTWRDLPAGSFERGRRRHSGC